MKRLSDAYMTYNTRTVAKLTGATLRKLQWWDEMGLLRAGRDEFGQRFYTRAQVGLVQIIVELSRYPGVSGPRACSLAKWLLHRYHVRPKTKNAKNVLGH